MLHKLKTHLKDVADNNVNPRFIQLRLLRIINRRIQLPEIMLQQATNKIVRYGGYESHLKPYMTPLHNGCFVDVGANFGRWTLYFANDNVEVHAFEPSPIPYSILERQTRSYQNVKLYACALGDRNGTVEINLHSQTGRNSIVIQSDSFIGSTATVQLRTLDSFKLANVGLLKIDTEGYEIPVLDGSRETIRRCNPRLIVEAHGDYELEKQRITNLVKQMGYQVLVKYRPETGQPHIIGEMDNSFI